MITLRSDRVAKRNVLADAATPRYHASYVSERPTMKRQACSYDRVAVPSHSYRLTDGEGTFTSVTHDVSAFGRCCS
jgi:hypothetical protein